LSLDFCLLRLPPTWDSSAFASHWGVFFPIAVLHSVLASQAGFCSLSHLGFCRFTLFAGFPLGFLIFAFSSYLRFLLSLLGFHDLCSRACFPPGILLLTLFACLPLDARFADFPLGLSVLFACLLSTCSFCRLPTWVSNLCICFFLSSCLKFPRSLLGFQSVFALVLILLASHLGFLLGFLFSCLLAYFPHAQTSHLGLPTCITY